MNSQTIYIFNPDHDLALASGETNYMAPVSARQMAADLAILPAWYMPDEAHILAPSAYHLDFLATMSNRFHRPMSLITAPELCNQEHIKIFPWGWNHSLLKHLLSIGIDECYLPTKSYIQLIRKYAHRFYASELLSRLQLNNFFCGEAFWLRNENDWKDFIEKHERCLLKAPLSGSGKGLNWCKGTFTSSIKGWCSRINTSQDGIIAEPVYNKTEDFAMEFYSNGNGNVHFVGFSLFHTNKSGMYTSNLLLSNEEILQYLSTYVPIEELIQLRDCLIKELSVLLGTFYHGYLGIDMMICHFPEQKPFYRIHPCVEINLRMNMGVTSRFLADRYLAPGVTGVFKIIYSSCPTDIMKVHLHMKDSYPLQTREGQIICGYQPLVPITPQSHYLAFICCGADFSNYK